MIPIRLFIAAMFFAALSLFAVPPDQSNKDRAAEEAAKLEEEKKNWPKTVDEAVTRIVSQLSEEDKKIVRDTPKEDLIQFHHGWGTGIRNSFGLWRGNRALMEDCKAKHPDSASMVIIRAVWDRLQEEKK
jgi:hypothetical protein